MRLLSTLFAKRKAILVIAVPFVLYVALTLPLSTWIVDDAGITFAYAKSLAAGHGLVSQPGAEPVEGYSNPLWLLLMAGFMVVGLFDPFITPKIISSLLILVSYIYVYRIITRYLGRGHFVVWLVLTCLSMNTSFLVWTSSGLENPLLVTLILILFYWCSKAVSGEAKLAASGAVCALIVLAIALTRPDGIVYAGVFPLLAIVAGLTGRHTGWRSIATSTSLNLGILALVYGAFFLFRYLYFGAWMPNTYYAKGGPSLAILVPAITLQEPYLTKFLNLIVSVVGTKLRFAVLVFIIVSSTLYFRSFKLCLKMVLLLVLVFISGFILIIMPDDWMPEYRFATAFFVFFYTLVISLGAFTINQLFSKITLRNIAAVVGAVLLLAVSYKIQAPRISHFYDHPTVSFVRITELFARQFDGYADKLGIENGSVLLPDVGGPLYYSRLRVYDLGRLTDRTIARTLRKNQKKFYDYVFETTRPTFIHIHGNWTYAARFDDDPRFRRDYVPIKEEEDRWIRARLDLSMMSGNYVRKDAVVGKEELLESLRGL